ncbi:MAG TPA: hypothetical protein VIG72_13645, partial [Pontibacter sp.]
SEAFSNNRAVLDETGRTVIHFEQPALSFSKGNINVASDLPEAHKAVLVSTSLYMKLVTDSTIAIGIILFLLFYVVVLR